MKHILLLLVSTTVCSANLAEDILYGLPLHSPTIDNEEQNRILYFPADSDDNSLYLVDTKDPVDTTLIQQYASTPNEKSYNSYWLYTRKNPTKYQTLKINDEQSIINSNFSKSKITVFLVHGWIGNGHNDMNTVLKEAFLEDGDVNVIVLDWHQLASAGYTTARSGVEAVGRGLGQFVNWLTTLGVPFDSIHLVGFSLGGHIVGNAGRETNGSIKRITALDPAGPLFFSSSPDRITSAAARYVEVIHTNTNLYGFYYMCGHADFYPNGGGSMPGCWLNSCSHSSAYKYYASTIKNNHMLSNECSSQWNAVRDKCFGSLHHMGNTDLNKNRTGVFRANTFSWYPFKPKLRPQASPVKNEIDNEITKAS